jgi:hypothetical protein
MLKFLRLLPAFRSLEKERDEAVSEWNRLFEEEKKLREERDNHRALLNASQERETYWKEHAAATEKKLDEMTAARIKSVELVADFQSQLRFGTRIFNHAPALPEKPMNFQPIMKSRVQARPEIQKAERKVEQDIFAQQLAEWQKAKAARESAAIPGLNGSDPTPSEQ